MGNHYHCLVLLMRYLLYQLEHFHSGVRIQVTGGLIREHYLGIDHKGPGYTHTLLLATAHLPRPVLHVFLKPHQLEHLDGTRFALRPAHSLERKRHGDILNGRHILHQIV